MEGASISGSRIIMDKFSRMIMGARKADADSIRELQNYIYEKSGVANKSLRALEKAGYTEYAYGRAMTFLQTEYQSIKFPQAVAKRTVEELIDQAIELHHFMKSPTRKVKGAKIVRERQIAKIEQLNQIGYNIPTDTERLRRINKALGNDGLKFVSSIRYELMEAIDAAYERGDTDKEVQMMIDRYATGELLYNDLITDLGGKLHGLY